MAGLASWVFAEESPLVTRPAEVYWGAYLNMDQLVGDGAGGWTFTREHVDGIILHGAYWGQTSGFSPLPQTVGPQLGALLAPYNKKYIYEALLAGLYPNIDSAFGTSFADTAITQIDRVMSWGFPQPDVSTDYIIQTWQEAVRWHPEWTSREFFTALTGNWVTYAGEQFDATLGASDRLRYGWFRQWVERLADRYPGVKVTATNSPVRFNWQEGEEDLPALDGGLFNAYPAWLKLERRGMNYTVSFSGDGKGWHVLGSTTVDLGSESRGGFMLSSGGERTVRATLNEIRFLPWFKTDIGRPGRGGLVEADSTGLTVTSHGNEFSRDGPRDAHFYVHREWAGDGEFIVRVDSLSGSNPERTWPLAGIVLRGSNQAEARAVSLHVTRGGQTRLQARLAPGSNLTTVATLADAGAPQWLRLTRTGNTVAAARSSDGLVWTSVGTVQIALPVAIKAGLVVDSQVRFETATARFSGMNFLDLPTSVQFSDADVGVVASGNTNPGTGVVSMQVSASGVGGTSDAMRFRHTEFEGDGTLLVRLADFADLAQPGRALPAEAQLGLTVREGLEPGATSVSWLFTPDGLLGLVRLNEGAEITTFAEYGRDVVSIRPNNSGTTWRPLLHYFSGNDLFANLDDAFPVGDSLHENFAGFTTDSPYAEYQRWGGSETHPDALRHRRKIIAYERWLQARGRQHEFIANSTGGSFTGFNVSTQAGRDAWDLKYKNDSLRAIQLHQLEGGRADKYLLESWYAGPYSLVPESKEGSFSNLAVAALRYLKGIGQSLDMTVRPPGASFRGVGVRQAEPSGQQILTHAVGATGETAVFTIRLINQGDSPALPLLHLHGLENSGWEILATLRGADVTSDLTGPGLAVTAAALYTGQELLAPGASVDIDLALTPVSVGRPHSVILRSYWNPQSGESSPQDVFRIDLPVPEQLLKNGAAADGTTAGWISNGGGSVTADTTIFRSGPASVRGNRSQPYQGPGQEILGRLEPGQLYRLTAWVRVGSGSHDVKVTLAYTGTEGPTLFSGLQIVTANASGWAPVNVVFRYLEPNGPAKQLRLYFEGPPSGVMLYVDDAELRRETFVWTRAEPGAHGWSEAGNWQGQHVAPSSPLTRLAFFTGQNLPPGELIITQNTDDLFRAESLHLGGLFSGSTEVRFLGEGWSFDRILVMAVGADANYTFTAPILSAGGDFMVHGDGEGTVTLESSLTGQAGLRKAGPSRLVLAADNDFPGPVVITGGVLRVMSPGALGQESDTLVIPGGNALAALELAGGHVFDRRLELAMHNTPGHAQLRNYSEHNVLNAPVALVGGGARWEIEVQAGSLVLAGQVANQVTFTDTWRVLHLVGPGAGVLTGPVIDSPTSRLSLRVVSGIWTLGEEAKSYTGLTMVEGGRLRVNTALASSVTVAAGASFDGEGGRTAGTLKLEAGSSLVATLKDWEVVSTGFEAERFQAPEGQAWTVRVESEAMHSFMELPREIRLVESAVFLNLVTEVVVIETPGFPGRGKWGMEVDQGVLKLVYTPPPYEAWAAGLDWGGADASPMADASGDGLPNLLAFALGRDPLGRTSDPAMALAAFPESLRMAFFRAQEGLDYQLEESTDLEVWGLLARNPGIVGQEVTVELPFTEQDPPRRFFRLRVILKE